MKGSEIACNIGRFIPCILIASIVGWSYYAMVIHIFLDYYKTNKPFGLLVVLLIIYHILTLLFLWAWLRTVLTKPVTCDHRYLLNEMEQHHFLTLQTTTDRDNYLKGLINQRQLVVKERADMSRSGGRESIRYCRKTGAIKPDRSHYDSMTKQLVLKMDHYCPWVANCIGYSNYKFFVMFLFYAITYCLFIMGTSLVPFLQVWSTNGGPNSPNFTSSFRLQTMFVFMAASIFSLSVVFLFSLHLYLISTNRTTIELYGSPIIENIGGFKHAYNISCMKNWKQVCGSSICFWFIPIVTDPEECDQGHRYPLNSKIFRQSNEVIV